MASALRRTGRLRFAAKVKQARIQKLSLREQPARWLRYVLTDPEVGDFTSDLADREGFIAEVAMALGAEAAQVRALFDELDGDAEFHARVRKQAGFRLDLKLPVRPGVRYAWYVLVRLRKPAVVVDTGVRKGIGAAILLRAIERNAAEDTTHAHGRLYSFDIDPHAGGLVPDSMRDHWTLVIGDTMKTLAQTLAGAEVVDVVFSDTIPELAETEFRIVLAHRAERVALCVGTYGDDDEAVPTIAGEHGAAWHRVHADADHFYNGDGFTLVEL